MDEVDRRAVRHASQLDVRYRHKLATDPLPRPIPHPSRPAVDAGAAATLSAVIDFAGVGVGDRTDPRGAPDHARTVDSGPARSS
jgi:hypothetical protein